MSIPQACPVCGVVARSEGPGGPGAQCPACGAALPGGAAEAADAAADFADMLQAAERDQRVSGAKVSLQHARSGSWALLAVAALYLATDVLYLLPVGLSNARYGEGWGMLGLGVGYGVAAVIFVGLFLWARRDPLLPLQVGLGLFVLLLVPSVIVANFLVGLIDLAILVGLIDGLRAALQHRRFLRRAAMRCAEAEGEYEGGSANRR